MKKSWKKKYIVQIYGACRTIFFNSEYESNSCVKQISAEVSKKYYK